MRRVIHKGERTGLETYLGTKAVPDSTKLLCALLVLEVLDGLQDDGVNGILSVRVLAVAALGEPLHEVDVAQAVGSELVAIEQVHQQRRVAVGSVLVGHELGVLPDAEDIREVKEGRVGVLVGAAGDSEVGVDVTDLDGLARGLALVLDADGAALCGRVGGHFEECV